MIADSRPFRQISRDEAETLAIAALAYLAARPADLARFLALSGLAPERLRAAAGEPGFLPAVLDYLGGDDALLLAFAEHAAMPPARVAEARLRLGGGPD